MREVKNIEEAVCVLRYLTDQHERMNDRGCNVRSGFTQTERYLFDFNVCRPELGWFQYDTWQDAHYFGMWYHPEMMATFCYCEGDCYFVEAPTVEDFKAEMEDAARVYGNPPPAFRCIDKNGHRSNIYDKNARPDLSNL